MLTPLFELLDYRPHDQRLFEQALTHRSFSRDHNERLEFLGDAVLDLLIGELLYRQLPDHREGELSRFRARLVSGEHLADMARGIGLGQYIRLGAGESKSGGADRDSILAGAFEALLGAVYLDGGLAEAGRIANRLFAERLADIEQIAQQKDAKTALQELLQARHLALPAYQLLRSTGSHHRQTFYVQCSIAGVSCTVEASGSSKKAAEQNAAAAMLKRLHREKQA